MQRLRITSAEQGLLAYVLNSQMTSRLCIEQLPENSQASLPLQAVSQESTYHVEEILFEKLWKNSIDLRSESRLSC